MKKSLILALTFMLVAIPSVFAVISYNQIIIAIFGSGNPNDGWTVSEEGDLKLALRAKNRETTSTANVDGVYAEPAGTLAPANTRALWNWEWSITSATGVSAYDYYVEIDLDPSTWFNNVVVNALTFWGDNSYGDATTLNGQGIETPFPTATVVQQSQNIAFAPYPALYAGDGTYTYTLYAVPTGAGPNGPRIATVGITVKVGAGGVSLPDADADGVPDIADLCPNTPPELSVNTQGCSVIQEQFNLCAVNAINHGDYESCIVKLANQLYKEGTITQAEHKNLIKTAAQSTIGN